MKLRVQLAWKEHFTVWDGDRCHDFPGGWGVEPCRVYLPPERLWDELVPTWLRGRRDEVLRLAASVGHLAEDDPALTTPPRPRGRVR